MAGSTYKGSYSGIGEMLRSDFLKAEMRRRGEKVLDIAIAAAPVYHGDEKDYHRGRYKESFSIRDTNEGGSKGNRAACYVENSSPEAPYVEYGGKGHRDARHVMRNALMSGAGD